MFILHLNYIKYIYKVTKSIFAAECQISNESF